MKLDDNIGLKLLGKNEEDVKTISAYLQDSIVSVKNIIFLKKNRTFIMLVNRFMWEDAEKGVFRKNKRIKSVVKFEEVNKVRSQNIDQEKKSNLLELLAIKCNLDINETYKINIFFSGGGIITIISESLDIILDDIGEPWNVMRAPRHRI
tara:strand:- start:319 stop:768 length:450 start_codon:yes stop_codon:yes gene_type:complete